MAPLGSGEEQAHVVGQDGPVVLEGEEIISSLVEDGLRDGGLRAHGVDRHQGSSQMKALQQKRDRDDLIGFFSNRLLTEHQALACRPGRDDVEGMAALRTGTARTLAVHRDDIGLGLAKGLHPGGEARRE